jgi:hypothetical protein
VESDRLLGYFATLFQFQELYNTEFLRNTVMNSEQRRISKDLAVTQFIPGVRLKILKKITDNSVRIACNPVEIRTGNPPKTSTGGNRGSET